MAGGIVGRLIKNDNISYSCNSAKVVANNSTQCFAGGIVGGTYPGGNNNVGKLKVVRTLEQLLPTETTLGLAKLAMTLQLY